jgi:hypothetical protein
MAVIRTGTRDKIKTRREGRDTGRDKIGETVRKNPSKDRTETTGRGSESSSRQKLRQELAQELLRLRSLLKDLGTNCLDRLDGELAGLALSLAGESIPGDPPVLPNPSVLKAMLADIRALKVKPKKGRAKDVRRIEALLESLKDQMPPEV